MRNIIPVIMLAATAYASPQYVYRYASGEFGTPRDLPSVGIRQSDGGTVLGLHGATATDRAACGWYQIIPAATQPTTNQIVVSRTYSLGGKGSIPGSVQEVLEIADVETRLITLEEIMQGAWEAMPQGSTDSERVSALTLALATTVTNRVATEITIVVPAARARAGGRQ